MISLLQGSSQLFITELGHVEQQATQAEQQVSSGLRITVASDDPDEIGGLLQLRSDLARNTQILSNLTMAQTDAQTADNALTSSIQLMTQALTLATQGANATMTVQGRQSIAQEIQGITQQMVANSNTTVQGRYIFSGDNEGVQAYGYDAASPATNYVDQLATAGSSREIEDPAGGSFPATLTAQQIFDDRNSDGSYATDNVFQALGNLYNALVSGDGDAIGASITNLQSASQHLNSMQAFYGEVEDRIQAGQTFANNYNTQLQTEIGNDQDADIPTAIMQMTQANTAVEAALEMEAKVPHTSLFNYLG